LFHNSNVFGSCIIHILYTGVPKLRKKFRRQKVKAASNRKKECPQTKHGYKTASRAREIIKNKNVHLELVSDTKFASGFDTDKGHAH